MTKAASRRPSGYGLLLKAVADSVDENTREALLRAAENVEAWTVVVTAAADFIRNEEGSQTRLGSRWYALADALEEAHAL